MALRRKYFRLSALTYPQRKVGVCLLGGGGAHRTFNQNLAGPFCRPVDSVLELFVFERGINGLVIFSRQLH